MWNTVRLEFKWEGRSIENKHNMCELTRSLLESSPDKVLVKNAVAVKIAPDVTPELILDRLKIENCAQGIVR